MRLEVNANHLSLNNFRSKALGLLMKDKQQFFTTHYLENAGIVLNFVSQCKHPCTRIFVQYNGF